MLKKLQRSSGSINIEFYNNQLKKLFQSGCSNQDNIIESLDIDVETFENNAQQ